MIFHCHGGVRLYRGGFLLPFWLGVSQPKPFVTVGGNSPTPNEKRAAGL